MPIVDALNALSPIEITLPGIVTSVNVVFENEELPIVVTFPPIVAFEIPVQPENALFPILITLFPIKIPGVIKVFPVKALSIMEVTVYKILSIDA